MQANELQSLIGDPFLTPATLAMNLWPTGTNRWIPGKHIVYASHRIAHAILKGNGRLILSMPPRTGKSRLISETTIPWFLEKFPGSDVILTSYNSDQAEKFGRAARDTMLNREDLFSVKVRKDVKRVDHFMTVAGSEVYFLGINSGATGKGAHLLIVDDYIKGIEEAMSPAHLEKLWLNFLANLDTRLEPGATVIIVATRWATRDIIGRILSSSFREKWEYIEFPAIALEDDILGRKKGDALFPERYPLERLNEIKQARTGTFLWESLYQQRPIDDISALTNGEWLRVVEPLGHNHFTSLKKARAWDMAATEGGGDFTVGALLGKEVDSSRGYILDVRRKQISPLKIEEEIRRTAEFDGTTVDILIEQEPGSQGKALIEHYMRNVLPEFNVIPVPVGGKKQVARVQPVIAAVEYQRIVAQEGPWVEPFRQEFDEYPPATSGHDDQVVAVGIAYNHLYANLVTSPVWWTATNGTGGYYNEEESFIANKVNKNKEALVSGCVW